MPGLYKHADGRVRAVVTVGPRTQRLRREKRFPPGTDRRDLVAWQTITRAALLAELPDAATSGTLAADVAAYLPGLPAAQRADRRLLLAHWTAVFGDRLSLRITRRQVLQQLETWRRTRAASTCNHRLTALHRLYQARYPDRVAWPTSRIPRFHEPLGEVRQIPPDVWRALVAAMPPSKAKACLEVFAETGIPPARLRRLRREDLDLEAETVYLEARRKGRGTLGRTFPLTQAAVRAFRAWVLVDGWGGVTSETMSTVFHRAVTRVNARRAKARLSPLPAMRVYDLRHTFGARAYALCGDVRAVAELLDVTIPTALRYTRAAVPESMQKVVAALDQAATKPRRVGSRVVTARFRQ